MKSTRLRQLLSKQKSLKEAIRQETRYVRVRKQKALYAIAKRAGLLELEDDEIEAAFNSLGSTHRSELNSRGA